MIDLKECETSLLSCYDSIEDMMNNIHENWSEVEIIPASRFELNIVE